MESIDATYPFIGKSTVNKIVMSLVVALPFLLTGFAIYQLWGMHVTWLDLGLFLGLQLLAGVGISLGFHRMLTHGAFKAKRPIQALFLWMGMQSLQGGPASWAATHRRHHALSDREGDPHSPVHGFWHAHFGWLFRGNLVHDGPAYERLMRDPVVRFFEKTQGIWFVFSFIMPGLIGLAVVGTMGAFWQALLWGGVVRVFFVHHVTWSINSICHTFGTRPFESPDVARNNGLFGWIGFGEGWHNNHHTFPKSAYLGLRWWQVDIGKYTLAVLRPFKLVYDLYVPSKEEQAAKRRRSPVRAAAMVSQVQK